MGTGHPQWPMTNLFPLLRAANAFHCVYITAVNCCWLVPLIWGHGLTRVQLLPPLCQRRYLLPFACWLLPAFEPCCIWPLPRGERWRNRVCLPVYITFCLPTSASSARTPHWLQQKPQACPYLVPVTFCSTNIKNIRQQSPCTQDPPHPFFLDPLGVLASCWVCREFPHSLTRGTALLIQILDLQIPTSELVLRVEGAVRTCSSIFTPMLGQLLHLGLLTSLTLRSGEEQTLRALVTQRTV